MDRCPQKRPAVLPPPQPQLVLPRAAPLEPQSRAALLEKMGGAVLRQKDLYEQQRQHDFVVDRTQAAGEGGGNNAVSRPHELEREHAAPVKHAEQLQDSRAEDPSLEGSMTAWMARRHTLRDRHHALGTRLCPDARSGSGDACGRRHPRAHYGYQQKAMGGSRTPGRARNLPIAMHLAGPAADPRGKGPPGQN